MTAFIQTIPQLTLGATLGLAITISTDLIAPLFKIGRTHRLPGGPMILASESSNGGG